MKGRHEDFVAYAGSGLVNTQYRYSISAENGFNSVLCVTYLGPDNMSA